MPCVAPYVWVGRAAKTSGDDGVAGSHPEKNGPSIPTARIATVVPRPYIHGRRVGLVTIADAFPMHARGWTVRDP